ncbi:MAG TPA: TIGR03118 family protein [Terriglobales bacterium]|nr:TIGR03118 family protein [Terriglobales bacterium]
MRFRALSLMFCLGLAIASSPALAQYQLTNLDSNQAGQAKHTDPLLVNGWGLAYGPGGPIWVSDQGSGWSTLYDGKGNEQSLKVSVPAAGGKDGPGQPTGIVFNGSNEFQLQGHPALFIFATLDGSIAAWSPQVNLNEALTPIDNSMSGAVYTALAITSKESGNMLFAADLANNKVDMYDGTFTLVGSFTDSTVPAGFAPFGIQDIDGLVYVAYAAVNEGPGGVIDIYSESGVFLKRLTQGAPLNQPWGMTAAPKNFGPLSNTLLVSNNTNHGTINAFDALTGEFVGTVKDANGKPIVINQLWGILFGGGKANDGGKNQLFFTAGPDNNLAGTFGAITFSNPN